MDVGSVIAAGLITATAALSMWLVSRTLWRISRPFAAAAGSGLFVSWLAALEDAIILRPLSSYSWLGVAGAPIGFVQFAALMAVVLAISWAPVLLIGLPAPSRAFRSVAAAWSGVLWAGVLVTALVYPAWRVTGICLPPGELIGGLGKDGRLIQECEIVRLYPLFWIAALAVLYVAAFATLARRLFTELRVRPDAHHSHAP